VREAGGVLHVWRDVGLAPPQEPGPQDAAFAEAWRWTVQTPLAATVARTGELTGEGVTLFATPIEDAVSEILAVAQGDAAAALARLSTALGAPDVPEPAPAKAQPSWVTVQAD
jgi:hypothetical protein